MKTLRTLRDIKNLKGTRVLLRADFNVQIKNGQVMDDYRIRAALPTIEFLRKAGAKLIIVSHLEVKDGEESTLAPVAAVLQKLGVPVKFVHEVADVSGDCVLLENLRHNPGEKKNDPKFANDLAALADVYVNDAFPVSHREHASIIGVPRIIPGYAGIQVEKEVENLSKAFSPAHPFLFILGGAKFETKMPLIAKFSSIADDIFIGGAIANDFYREQGYEVGQSTLSSGDFDIKSLLGNPKISIAPDVVDQNHVVKAANAGTPTDIFLDIGPKSIEMLRPKIAAAKFILWNGTLGYCEKGFADATNAVAKLIADQTRAGALSIVGGGDTVAALSAAGLDNAFSFVSTAGGAMLDFLAKGTLPGLEALK